MAQIGGRIDLGHADQAGQPRILDLAADQLRYLRAKQLVDAVDSTVGWHRYSIRSRAYASMMSPGWKSLNSTTVIPQSNPCCTSRTSSLTRLRLASCAPST